MLDVACTDRVEPVGPGACATCGGSLAGASGWEGRGQVRPIRERAAAALLSGTGDPLGSVLGLLPRHGPRVASCR